MDWITSQIAVGNFKDAADPPESIDSILCLKPECSCDMRDEPLALSVPLVDGPGNDPRDMAVALGFIAEEVSDGRNILVHCHAGRSRSVIVVARFLMESEGLSRDEALARIRMKRDVYLTKGISDLLTFVLD